MMTSFALPLTLDEATHHVRAVFGGKNVDGRDPATLRAGFRVPQGPRSSAYRRGAATRETCATQTGRVFGVWTLDGNVGYVSDVGGTVFVLRGGALVSNDAGGRAVCRSGGLHGLASQLHRTGVDIS